MLEGGRFLKEFAVNLTSRRMQQSRQSWASRSTRRCGLSGRPAATFWNHRGLLAACLLALWSSAFLHADRCSAQFLAPREITAADVEQSIERGIKYIKEQQQADGTWPDRPGYAGGLTPLCTLSLLNAGLSPDDDAVKRALTYLRGFRSNGTYATSLQTMALCAARPEADRLLIVRNVKWLEGRQIKKGSSAGMWAFPAPSSPDHVDNSMTHIAMLALYEAERVGVSASDQTWRLALEFWQKNQNPDGSWGWGPGYEGSGSMTCAGIAAIIMASGQLNGGDATVEGNQIKCCGQGQSSDHVARALDWLERNFSVQRNPGVKFWLSYYLYSLERAGRLTARRFIGTHDWYREGAHMLVNRQRLNGAWPSDLDNEYRGDPIVGSSFSLMFLAKARRPVLLARVQHQPGDDWNHHRRSLFNMVDYVEHAWQRPLAYQVVNIAAASVEDLLETPVLFLSGSQAPQFTAEEKQKLRMYVDRGGFIFAEQCCGSGNFDQGFRQLMQEIFPEAEAKLRLLPANHPVWYAEQRVAPDQMRELWGVDVGCRTSVVYCPQDLSCLWELAGPHRGEPLPETVQKQIAGARAIGINVLAYATNREVKYKDPAALTPVAADNSEPLQRGTLQVANVLHPGGCDAAPGALPTLLRLAADKLDVKVSGRPSEVRLSDPELFRHHLVLMHGRTSFTLTPTERKQLRVYLERGGMLFADAICSNKAFADSFVHEMQEIFPEQKLERIPATHPLFSRAFGGDEIPTVSLRKPEKGGEGRLSSTVRPAEPNLEALKVGDRFAVIFSRYDVSCALEGHETLECEGYTAPDAARIALNVLLYSFHQ
jgi:hypothetical protein